MRRTSHPNYSICYAWCAHCEMEFHSENELKKSKTKLLCPFCHITPRFADRFKRRRSDKKLKCPTCKATTQTIFHMDVFLRYYLAIRSFKYCMFCNEIFERENDLLTKLKREKIPETPNAKHGISRFILSSKQENIGKIGAGVK